MTPADLSSAISAAVAACLEAGEFTGSVPAEIVVDRPRTREHGDYATNVAMRLAKDAGKPPRDVAAAIAARLLLVEGIARVDVAGPGFLNITLAPDSLAQVATQIVAAGVEYGSNQSTAGLSVNLEYVSANPTGPVHLAHARWASVGDALSRLFKASGAEVTREYYFNDAGSQIDRFAASLYATAHGEEVAEDGYRGDYISEVAGQVVAANPGLLDESPEKATEIFRRDGVELMFDRIKTALHDFGVDFDVYFNERDLHASGAIDRVVQQLRDSGHVFEADGAVWLRTTEFGDDKDRVIVRSNGQPTYFCADLAYYVDKRNRGADKVLIILGADHHGYVGRLRGLVAGLGENPDETLEILIGQLVTTRGGRMSKRAGNLVTLADLVEAIGVDAARYALVRSSTDSAIDLDLDLWASRTNDNPVFYVQYAHVRLSSLLHSAADLCITRSTDPDLSLLSDEREAQLLSALAEFPRVVGSAAELRAAHRVARYLEELAGTYHRFYDSCRVLPQGDEEATPLTDARLWLCEATRIVLANGLGLLGVHAPERM
ncbi:MAG: arginine--tRNA ligase [Jatrophihabitans sp.]